MDAKTSQALRSMILRAESYSAGGGLLLLAEARAVLDDALRERARAMQAQSTWAAVGRVFGISPQAAWERFGKPREDQVADERAARAALAEKRQRQE